MSNNWLQQTLTISFMNIQNLPQRVGSSSVAIFGVACVVGVFIGVLSMAAGFQQTMVAAGSEDTLVILRAGSTSELNSGFSYEQTQLITNAEGVRRDNDKAVVAAELYVIVDIPKRSTDLMVNVPFRGVQSGSFQVRDNIEIVQGRMFEEGRNEMIVGRAAQQQFKGLELGNKIKFGQSEWEVVGIFEDNGSVSESELWCDVRVLQSTFRRGNSFQTVRVKLSKETGALEKFKASVAADPRLNLSVQTEVEYFSNQSKSLSSFIESIGYPLTILMAIGAIFGALNTMYSSVSARTREIATLRALGFGTIPVAVSTLLESLLLALVGGLIGSIVVYILFNGYTVSTINGETFSQVVFDFAITGELLIDGVQAALWIGFIGGLLPAIRASKLVVATALREQ